MPSPAAAEGEWVDIAFAAARLGMSPPTIWRLVNDGVIPSIRAEDAVGSTYRVPGQLFEDARRAVMAGGKIVLREFAREWAAGHAVPTEAVA
jgi:excisionase family DNA binding protein